MQSTHASSCTSAALSLGFQAVRCRCAASWTVCPLLRRPRRVLGQNLRSARARWQAARRADTSKSAWFSVLAQRRRYALGQTLCHVHACGLRGMPI